MWTVKIDGKYIYVAGAIGAELARREYTTPEDYKWAKELARSERLNEHPTEEMLSFGYIDLDETEARRAGRVIIVGDFIKKNLGKYRIHMSEAKFGEDRWFE